MNILAFDCCSAISIGLLKDDKLIDKKFFDQNTSHSEKLVLEIKNLVFSNNLDLKNIDLFVANNGPGGYTGIRVALSVLKMFKISYQKPCLTLNSFEILTNKYFHQKTKLNIAIKGNANEIFFAKYNFLNGKILQETQPIITDLDSIKKQLNPNEFICGSANKLFVDHQFKSEQDDVFLVDEMLILGEKLYKNNLSQEILPLYLREPKTSTPK